MSFSLSLNREMAKDSTTGGGFVNKTGKYTVKIKFAYGETNKNGTEILCLGFHPVNGQELRPLPIYTRSTAGDLQGLTLANHILYLLKLEQINPREQMVELYDYETRKNAQFKKACFPELSNRDIGLCLQQEEFVKSNGDVGERLIINMVFDPVTGKTSRELIGKTEAKDVASNMAYLDDHPIKKLKASANSDRGGGSNVTSLGDRYGGSASAGGASAGYGGSAGASRGNQAAQRAPAESFDDDEIPFDFAGMAA